MGHFHHKKLYEKSFKEMFLHPLFPLILSKYGKILIMPKDQRGLLTRCYTIIFWLCLKTERLEKSPSLTALMECCFFCCILEVKRENFWRRGHCKLMWPFLQMQPLKQQI